MKIVLYRSEQYHEQNQLTMEQIDGVANRFNLVIGAHFANYFRRLYYGSEKIDVSINDLFGFDTDDASMMFFRYFGAVTKKGEPLFHVLLRHYKQHNT